MGPLTDGALQLGISAELASMHKHANVGGCTTVNHWLVRPSTFTCSLFSISSQQ